MMLDDGRSAAIRGAAERTPAAPPRSQPGTRPLPKRAKVIAGRGVVEPDHRQVIRTARAAATDHAEQILICHYIRYHVASVRAW
jgi:hypothetical protein